MGVLKHVCQPMCAKKSVSQLHPPTHLVTRTYTRAQANIIVSRSVILPWHTRAYPVTVAHHPPAYITHLEQEPISRLNT